MGKNSIAGLLLALLCAGSMWFYVNDILVPYQIRDAATSGRPRGNLSDLYPRWLGARELLLHGRDPYAPEITREIQAGFYGRPLNASRPADPQDQAAFAYPLYVVVLLAPTVKFPFPLVKNLTTVFFWLLTIASVPLWLKGLRWKPRPRLVLIFVILTMGSLPVVQGLKQQQLTLLVAGILAAAAASVASGYLTLGGVLLALATIKPQLAWLAVFWMLAWSARDWHKRHRLVWGFAVTLAALLLVAQILLPGWIGEFVQAIRNYHQYTHNQSVLGWLLTPVLGNATAAVLVVACAVPCWRMLARDQSSRGFAVCLALVLALTALVVPMTAPYNQVLLLAPVMLLTRHVRSFWREAAAIRVALGFAAFLLVAPWAITLGLMASSGVLSPYTIQAAWKLPFAPSLLFPIFIFGMTLLLAVREPGRQEAVAVLDSRAPV